MGLISLCLCRIFQVRKVISLKRRGQKRVGIIPCQPWNPRTRENPPGLPISSLMIDYWTV